MTDPRTAPREDGEPPFPGSVLVGFYRFPVSFDPGLADEDGRPSVGRFDYFPRKDRRLRFRPGLPIHELAETLVHELLHAAYSLAVVDAIGVRGWKEIAEAEEWFVSVGALGLTGIMLANPEVRDWLAWAWSRGP